MATQQRCETEVHVLLFVADRSSFRKKKLLLGEIFFHRRAANTFFPGKTARAPSSSSIRNNWLYFAVRSPRQTLPVLICPAFNATARSAIVVPSVSPARRDRTEAWPRARAGPTV